MMRPEFLFLRGAVGGSGAIYRNQMAKQALKANRQVTSLVGHSLGGAVLQKDDPRLASRTYGAPVWDPFGTGNTERGYGIFDRSKPGGVE
jgi:hypothetical protein